MRFRLNRQHPGDCGWVVPEVEAVAGADLDHGASEPGEQCSAVFGHAAALHRLGHLGIDPGEDRMMDRLAAHRSAHGSLHVVYSPVLTLT
jgi:hypothetical protein